MKKEKIILALCPIALLLAMISASAADPLRTPGVTSGDTFTYGNFNFYWYSNDSSATPPAEWADVENAEWFSVTVENVVDKNITGSLMVHFNNGTEMTDSGWVNVDTGDGANMSMFFISANLNIGDSIYTSGDYSSWMINETIPRTYDGDVRDTNHLNMTMEYSMGETYYVHSSMNFYWDKTTGALVEMSMMLNQTILTGTTEYSISVELTGSNVWVVPEFGLPQTLLLLASLTLVTLAYKLKLQKPRNR
jgi:hypothetical protein